MWLRIAIGFGGAFLFVVVGVLLLARGVKLARQIWRVQGWRTVKGVVEEFRFESVVENFPSSAGASPITNVFKPIMKYKYNVDGVEYTSGIFSPVAFQVESKRKAERMEKEFLAGNSIPVYDNPQKPMQSVAVRRVPRGVVGIFLTAFGLMLGSVIVALGVLKS